MNEYHRGMRVMLIAVGAIAFLLPCRGGAVCGFEIVGWSETEHALYVRDGATLEQIRFLREGTLMEPVRTAPDRLEPLTWEAAEPPVSCGTWYQWNGVQKAFPSEPDAMDVGCQTTEEWRDHETLTAEGRDRGMTASFRGKSPKLVTQTARIGDGVLVCAELVAGDVREGSLHVVRPGRQVRGTGRGEPSPASSEAASGR